MLAKWVSTKRQQHKCEKKPTFQHRLRAIFSLNPTAFAQFCRTGRFFCQCIRKKLGKECNLQKLLPKSLFSIFQCNFLQMNKFTFQIWFTFRNFASYNYFLLIIRKMSSSNSYLIVEIIDFLTYDTRNIYVRHLWY